LRFAIADRVVNEIENRKYKKVWLEEELQAEEKFFPIRFTTARW
jgi:hypothetical protein